MPFYSRRSAVCAGDRANCPDDELRWPVIGWLNLHDLDFTAVDLSDADLSDADLRGTKLVAAKLVGASYRGRS